ncbi:MAG: hypothetical protein WBX07_10700, partial [Rhodoplanes sp.]
VASASSPALSVSSSAGASCGSIPSAAKAALVREGHPTTHFGVPPDGVVALGADLLYQALVEQALDHVASGIYLEPGGDGEDAAIGPLAGGGENDELGIGQLRHGFAP